MKLVDLSLEPYDGFQPHRAHARTTVMDFVTHAFSAPRYRPPLRIEGATGSPIQAVAVLD